MKTFDERTNQVMQKIDTAIQKKRKRNRIITAATASLLLVIIVAAVLFVPYEWMTPSVLEYADSGYYSLIKNLNRNKYRDENNLGAATPKNNFEYLLAMWNYEEPPRVDLMENVPNAGKYVENTDNQVQGVIEGDLVKRTEDYIFRLSTNDDSEKAILRSYTIDGADSKCVGTENVDVGFMALYDAEMYLSDDGKIVTVILYGSKARIPKKDGKGTEFDTRVYVLSYDVSNPAKMQRLGEFNVTGEYSSSRKVGQSIFLLSRKFVYLDYLDFDDKDTYLPQYGSGDNRQYLPPEAIIEQDEQNSNDLATMWMLREGSLELMDAAALLSRSRFFYMSAEHIYIPSTYGVRTDYGKTKSMTDIVCLSYTADSMEHIGTTTVEGHIRNQYSMDEYNGILRVVTSTIENTLKNGGEWIKRQDRNANLYCISLADGQIQGKVVAFAPWGDEVRSVRFDGDTAYVCTARRMTDPVYFFDLSDPKNITWKDTGKIPGYSASLRTFGDYLLGIGYNEYGGSKISLYRETETGVEEVCNVDTEYSFSSEYKSYLIDEENMLIAIPIYGDLGLSRLMVWQLEDGKLVEKHDIAVNGMGADIRALLIDEYLYVLGANLVVKKIK